MNCPECNTPTPITHDSNIGRHDDELLIVCHHCGYTDNAKIGKGEEATPLSTTLLPVENPASTPPLGEGTSTGSLDLTPPTKRQAFSKLTITIPHLIRSLIIGAIEGIHGWTLTHKRRGIL